MNWTRCTIATALAAGTLTAAGCTLVYYEPRPARVVYAPAPAPALEPAPQAPPAPVSPGYAWGQPQPQLVVVPGTEIRYINIPDDDIFFFGNIWYRFWSGHWYSCSRYGGVWVRLAVRPSFVVHIPRTHVRYRVVSPPPAWYWGRPDPRLTIIAGTDIRYVVDTDDDVFFYSGLWYRWDGHFWFSCRTYGGSWMRLAARPTFVPRIPTTHLKYHVVKGEPPRSHPVVKPPEPRPRPGEPAAPHPVVRPPEHGPRPGEPAKPREVHKVEVRPVPTTPEKGRPEERRGPDREPPKARDEREERREEKAPEKPRVREEERERHEVREPEKPKGRTEEQPQRGWSKPSEQPKGRTEPQERREEKPQEKPKTESSKSRGREESKSRRPEDQSDDAEDTGTDGRGQGKGRGGR